MPWCGSRARKTVLRSLRLSPNVAEQEPDLRWTVLQHINTLAVSSSGIARA